ncbi:hypothetical protein U14_01390 [Candidatus Moduliflexus flocculans]|uniref:AB hydrolase-1 domain-containing protein n=1 Tax=Candidatus Moduliflexus flocculans TaxID=1499966 RepID=A0A0S6VXM2_9BACT|nr:hypothetical protein U14_01390 [Candidatus Moduliflexus flocculans]
MKMNRIKVNAENRSSLSSDRQWGTSLVLAWMVIFLTSCAGTPLIKDENGKKRPQSIASLEQIELLGKKQWILLRGVNVDAPILLWLAGGPCGSEIGWTRKYLAPLENDVIFVNWDQPGAGKSYKAADFKQIRVQNYVDATIALSEYLAMRFKKEKIFLAGHSWGSIIGVMAAHQRPDLYYAYIGIGQQVNSVENDQIGYNMVLKQARQRGDHALVKKLEKNGLPPYTQAQKGAYIDFFRHLPSCPPGICSKNSFWEMVKPKEYTLLDSLHTLKGLINGINMVYPQLVDLDFERDVPQLDIPAFFVTGRYDYTCVQDIAYRYYAKLHAPLKRFYWLEKSGHNPCYQEPERFIQLLRDDILKLAE